MPHIRVRLLLCVHAALQFTLGESGSIATINERTNEYNIFFSFFQICKHQCVSSIANMNIGYSSSHWAKPIEVSIDMINFAREFAHHNKRNTKHTHS